MHEPYLQWVYVGNEIHNILDYKDLPKSHRPHAICPICREQVTLKLGRVRIEHAAHKPGSNCPIFEPDRATHLNSIFYLRNELLSARELRILQPCIGWASEQYHMPCLEKHCNEFVYLENWDEVKTEFQFGPFRLDLALLREGKLIGAIEALYTHATIESKADYLNQSGIPWIEFRASESFYSGKDAWNPSTPLRVTNFNEGAANRWQCPNCQWRSDIANQKPKHSGAFIKEDLNSQLFTKQAKALLIRYIDYYHPSLKRDRILYVIEKRSNGDKEPRIQLRENRENNKVIDFESSLVTDISLDKLKNALEEEINAKEGIGWLADRTHQWTPVNNDKANPDEDDLPFNYTWDKEKGSWIKIS